MGDHTDRGEPAAGRAGITRAIYGLTDDAASDLLRRHSQHSNLKLRDLAARLTEALPAVDIGTPVNTTRMDRMLAAIIGDGRQPTGERLLNIIGLPRSTGRSISGQTASAQRPSRTPHSLRQSASAEHPTYWVLTGQPFNPTMSP